jgi:hypothetical protein
MVRFGVLETSIKGRVKKLICRDMGRGGFWIRKRIIGRKFGLKVNAEKENKIPCIRLIILLECPV